MIEASSLPENLLTTFNIAGNLDQILPILEITFDHLERNVIELSKKCGEPEIFVKTPKERSLEGKRFKI